MVRTMITRDPIIGTRQIYTKVIIIVTRSFHDKFYIVSIGMNTKVQGRLPPLQCITFNSLLGFDEFVLLEIFTWRNTSRAQPVQVSGLAQMMEIQIPPIGRFIVSIRQPS